MAAGITEEQKQEIREAAIAEREAYTNFAHDYTGFVKSRGLHTPITPSEVLAIQDEYAANAKQCREDLAKLTEKYPDYDFAEDPKYKAMSEEINQDVKDWNTQLTIASIIVSNNAEQYGGKTTEKNTDIGKDVKTNDQLYQELIANNKGLAVGDAHTQSESLDIITKNMAEAKKLGVDTVYVEMESEDYKFLENLSDKELQQLHDTGKITVNGETKNLVTSEKNAEEYGYEKSDDHPKAMMGMLLAARKEGIRVVPIDDRKSTNQVEDVDPARVGITNMEWPANIEKDRKENGLTGKYVVFGGVNHFNNSDIKGVVDEKLGIPSIIFDKSEQKTNSFKKADKDSGVDYVMEGGADYPPVVQHGKESREAVKEDLQKMGYDPVTMQKNNAQPAQGNGASR